MRGTLMNSFILNPSLPVACPELGSPLSSHWDGNSQLQLASLNIDVVLTNT